MREVRRVGADNRSIAPYLVLMEPWEGKARVTRLTAFDLAATDDLFDPPERALRKAAVRIKATKNVKLPRLDYWNYDPCFHHEEPLVHCEYRACGGEIPGGPAARRSVAVRRREVAL